MSAPTSSGLGGSGSSRATRLRGQRPAARIAEPEEHTAERAHRPRGVGQVAASLEGGDRLLQRLGRLAEASGMEGGLAEAGQRPGPFGMPGGGEGECPLETRQGRGGVEAEGALAGQAEEPSARVLRARPPARSVRRPGRAPARSRSGRRGRRRGPRPGRGLSTRSSRRQRHGGWPVRRGGAGCRRRPGRGCARTHTPPRPPSTTAGPDAPAPSATAPADVVVTCARSRSPICGDRTGPEHLPDHRRIRQQRLRVRLQRVQPGGDQRLHRLRERHLRTLPQLPARALPDQQVAVFQQPHELLRIERVAAGTLEDRLLQLGRQHRRVQAAPRRAGRSPPARAAPG